MTIAPLTEAQLQERLGHSTFIDFMGLTVISTDPAREEVVMRAPMRPEFERGTGSGQWHGGPMAAVIDTVGDFALVMLLGRALPTINFRVDYLRPAANADLLAQARVRRAGRTIGVVDIDVTDPSGRLIALGRGCYGTQPG
jgi:uncharacterized protein (TIGR00369 family)